MHFSLLVFLPFQYSNFSSNSSISHLFILNFFGKFKIISVQEATGYQPQVEAISPTPEDRPAERDDIKSTKDDLLQKISKVDREIAKAESQIAKLKKKQVCHFSGKIIYY